MTEKLRRPYEGPNDSRKLEDLDIEDLKIYAQGLLDEDKVLGQEVADLRKKLIDREVLDSAEGKTMKERMATALHRIGEILVEFDRCLAVIDGRFE